MIEILKAIILGIVEGITEWLPISSTGHMILVDEFLQLNTTENFKEMFFVVIQLGAILAVLMMFWNKMFPFSFKDGFKVKEKIIVMWLKIFISCIPAGVVGILWDDKLNELFYNYQTVAVMLILFGVLFIIIENIYKNKKSRVKDMYLITFYDALLIGVFQLIAAVFPGTSRSGATILGALLIGISRTAAAEYTFILAVPVMFGASILKMLKFGFSYTSMETIILVTGVVVAFFTSVFTIKFLMNYIRKHDFKVFGWYRIVLGCLVLGYFFIFG